MDVLQKSEEELHEIAQDSITKRVDNGIAFIFRDPTTQETIAIARNLTDLLVHMGEVPEKCLRYHLYRTTNIDLDGEVDGEQPRSDIALWIQYVLGDDELASKIWELRENLDSENLRSIVLKIVQDRHDQLRAILKK